MRHIRCVLFVGTFLFVPSFVLAAGFATQPLFLSQTTVTEGDTVQLYAVVSNSDLSNKFTGTIVFQDATTTIGTIPVTLAAGGANTASISWKPLAGTHEVSAELTDTSGTIAGQESATFVINPKQQQAVAAVNATIGVDSSQVIQQRITSFSPVVANTTKPIFATVDSARTVAAGTLDSGITWSKQQIIKAQNTKQLLGASVTASSSSPTVSAGNSAISTAWVILATVLLYILSVLRYIVANAGIFYPVAVILFCYILWRTYKHFRRPRYY